VNVDAGTVGRTLLLQIVAHVKTPPRVIGERITRSARASLPPGVIACAFSQHLALAADLSRMPHPEPDDDLDEYEAHALGLLDTLPLINVAEEVPPPMDERH
jgi:hypothetical protein